ncbi:Prostaglandin E2 receptor EP3 subtype [Trichoplax sp. H2]|nr:Prostaglandin E2 receptor EP3 subtype [Trichoplax sp. H2]|eukprot:RDD37283.1 Prostaglandin E2 receptor EP3 subtype [Trichoplax sp. H2]
MANQTTINSVSVEMTFTATSVIPKATLWSNNYCLLTSLAVAKFFTGLIVVTTIIAAIFYKKYRLICQIQGSTLSYFNGASFVVAAGVSIDRCSAVINPYRYISELQTRRYAVMIISGWILPISIAILPLLNLQRFGFGQYTFQDVC